MEERRLGLNGKKEKNENGEESSDDSDSFEDSVAFGSHKKKIGNDVNDVMVEIDYEHPEIPQYDELAWNFFLMPAIIYSGFGRMIITSERKKTF